jgi:cobalt-precorrin 5A hydrolase
MKPITIVSLTEPGRALSQRLLQHYSDAEHLHQPQPFQTQVQKCFQAGHRLILIFATGIAVRTLAPVLRDKYQDPAVLVMDEHGRYVVPLLAGHEGGANAWGRQVSELLAAQCVITGAQRYIHPLLIAGVGCARHCPLQPLMALLDTTLQSHGLSRQDLTALASIDIKQNEAGLQALAKVLDVPFACYPATTLLTYNQRLTQHSEIVYRETGCYGVAEAAALAHAERLVDHQQAELLIPKHKNSYATCAVARVYDEARTP